MGRVYNFSAGPAVLPEEVLRKAHREEMLDYKGCGMSIMEVAIAPRCSMRSSPRPSRICAT